MRNFTWSLVVLMGWVLSLSAQQTRTLAWERFEIPSDSAQHYKVFDPDPSNTAQRSAILIFDPSGEAGLALQAFEPAARQYGYLLVASENITNDTYQENFNKVRLLLEDLKGRYPLDERQLYAAGFSGGARLALASAVISRVFKGVIVCGASFAFNSPYIPKEPAFDFVGVVGNRDFNFREMRLAQAYLRNLKFDARLLEFQGGHQWPDPGQITKAVRTLRIKAYQKGLLTLDPEEREQLFKQDLEYFQALKDSELMLAAYQDLNNLRMDYPGLMSDEFFREERKLIRKNAAFRQQQYQREEVDYLEGDFQSTYLEYLPQDIKKGDLEALGYWDNELKALNERYTNSKSTEERNMAIRIKGLLEVVAMEVCSGCTPEANTDSLLFREIFLTLVDPQQSGPYLNILPLAVRKGEYGIALFYLEELLKTGYKDVDVLNDMKGIALLRIQPEYSELLEAYGLPGRY